MADPKPAVADPGVAYVFKVRIDGHELGLWNSFEGLGMETSIETREEGGNNFFVHQLPGRLKYTNVKISRPLGCAGSSGIDVGALKWHVSVPTTRWPVSMTGRPSAASAACSVTSCSRPSIISRSISISSSGRPRLSSSDVSLAMAAASGAAAARCH